MPWPAGIPAWLKNQWGIISGQVSARATTAQLINSLRAYAAAAPGGWGPQGIIYVTKLRSIAVAIRNAADQIISDGFRGTIGSQHIADSPWARSPIQMQAAPRFMIRSLVTSPNPEAIAGVEDVPDEIERWITHYTTALPATLDELTEQIQARAEESGSPPLPVTGISRIEILRE